MLVVAESVKKEDGTKATVKFVDGEKNNFKITNQQDLLMLKNYMNLKYMNKLIEIHDNGIKEHKEGCLGLKCSSEENKMDAFFMDLDSQMPPKWSQKQSKFHPKTHYFPDSIFYRFPCLI